MKITVTSEYPIKSQIELPCNDIVLKCPKGDYHYKVSSGGGAYHSDDFSVDDTTVSHTIKCEYFSGINPANFYIKRDGISIPIEIEVVF